MSASSTPSTTEQPATPAVQPLEAASPTGWIPWAYDERGNPFILF